MRANAMGSILKFRSYTHTRFEFNKILIRGKPAPTCPQRETYHRNFLWLTRAITTESGIPRESSSFNRSDELVARPPTSGCYEEATTPDYIGPLGYP